ncbi:MAG: glycosyl hydrolase 108 family protein [Amaricoccus sp.]
MSRENFESCLDFVFEREGGYVDDPHDPGGATNMGITLATLAAWRGRAVTKGEVRGLSRAETAAIYQDRYWRPVGGDALPTGLDLFAFDTGVHSGPKTAIRLLQRGLGGIDADGRLGRQTLAAAARADGPAAIRRACAARLAYMHGLRNWSRNQNGWTKRVALLEARATRMWLETAGHDPAPLLGAEAKRTEKANATRDAQAAGSSGAAATAIAGAVTLLPDRIALAITALVVLALGCVIWRLLRGHLHDVARRAAFTAEGRLLASRRA